MRPQAAAHRPAQGVSAAGAALVAVGALAVGVVLGRHTAPAPLGRTELLSAESRLRGPGPSGLAQSRAMQLQAEAEAVRELDADRFPGETDDYLFQRVGAPLHASASGTYNPYLEGPCFPPSIKNYPFHDFYIPVSEESTADEVFSLPPLPYPYESLEPNIDRCISPASSCAHACACARTHARNTSHPHVQLARALGNRYTMYLHHDKHFDAYRKNLNVALAADPELSHNLVSLQATAISGGNVAVRNNGGGFYVILPQSPPSVATPQLVPACARDSLSLPFPASQSPSAPP